ncbi:hypothetical protein HDU98_006599 [Podochytrium sp. JEL0797]|nr:hypothetical protein HDU98_006599 [Podochytrium sp. JEL0797]
MQSLPPETLLHICVQLSNGTIDGTTSLIHLASTCSLLHRLVFSCNPLWKAHFLAAFDNDTDPDSTACEYMTKTIQRWKLVAPRVPFGVDSLSIAADLVRQNTVKNTALVLQTSRRMLCENWLERALKSDGVQLNSVMSVFVHAAWNAEEMKRELRENAFVQNCITKIIRVERFLEEDNGGLLISGSTKSSRKRLKLRFLQLALILRLPLFQATGGIPTRLTFWPQKMSVATWDALQSANPAAFWSLLIPGEWTGFYADYRLDIDPATSAEPATFRTCDGPMHNMRFEWTPETADAITANKCPHVLSFTGRGEDDFHEFEVVGRVLSRTRDVFMRKTYLTGLQLSWELEGTLNEFGIVGSWGQASGTFFIWRV